MPRLRQFLSALALIAAVAAGIVGLWLGRYLPGSAGELFQAMFRLLTTPIILEISFFSIGLLIVMALSHYHETRHNEWVEMDFPDEPSPKSPPIAANSPTDSHERL